MSATVPAGLCRGAATGLPLRPRTAPIVTLELLEYVRVSRKTGLWMARCSADGRESNRRTGVVRPSRSARRTFRMLL